MNSPALLLFSHLHSASCPLPPQLVAPSPKSISSSGGRASSSKSETASADGVGGDADDDTTENEDDATEGGGKGSKSEKEAQDKAEVHASSVPFMLAASYTTNITSEIQSAALARLHDLINVIAVVPVAILFLPCQACGTSTKTFHETLRRSLCHTLTSV